MKNLYLVANWKSNKSISETEDWLHKFSDGFLKFKPDLSQKEIVVSPSFISLEHANYCNGNLKLPIKFAVQNISPFDEGSYTGEVNGKQIKELADYVLIGHSERRKNFGETDEMLFEKVKFAKENGLTTIYCVQGKETKIPANVDIIAYEPVSAIGTGNPDTPENAEDIGAYLKANCQDSFVLYGGSVTADNVNSFTRMPSIDGVLVGKASLDPLEFLQISKNA